MHLLDNIVQSKQALIVRPRGGTDVWHLPGSGQLAASIEECPLRYVLRDDVTELCTKLAFEEDTILGSSIELLRVPASRLWVEFASHARHKVFSSLNRLSDGLEHDQDQRIGLLIASDRDGRKGQIDVFWENLSGLGPDLAPFRIDFDFDDETLSSVANLSGDATELGIEIPDHRMLNPLYRHVRFELRQQWHNYYRQRAASESRFREVLHAAVKPLLEDVPFFATFCLLLISRDALREQHSDRARLNKSRAKRGRAPLLDHVELTINLGEHEHPERTSEGGERTSPRLHFVRGHLVRRGDSIHWRTSHMRGTPVIGSIRCRTVTLRVAAG